MLVLSPACGYDKQPLPSRSLELALKFTKAVVSLTLNLPCSIVTYGYIFRFLGILPAFRDIEDTSASQPPIFCVCLSPKWQTAFLCLVWKPPRFRHCFEDFRGHRITCVKLRRSERSEQLSLQAIVMLHAKFESSKRARKTCI